MQQRGVGLLFEGGVEGADGDDQSGSFLRAHQLQGAQVASIGRQANHAGAWEDVPTEADAIAILNLTPLLLQGIVIHDVGCLQWQDVLRSGNWMTSEGVESLVCSMQAGISIQVSR